METCSISAELDKIRSGNLFKFWHVFFFFFFNNNVQTKSRGDPNMTRIRILLDQENS